MLFSFIIAWYRQTDSSTHPPFRKVYRPLCSLPRDTQSSRALRRPLCLSRLPLSALLLQIRPPFPRQNPQHRVGQIVSYRQLSPCDIFLRRSRHPSFPSATALPQRRSHLSAGTATQARPASQMSRRCGTRCSLFCFHPCRATGCLSRRQSLLRPAPKEGSERSSGSRVKLPKINALLIYMFQV